MSKEPDYPTTDDILQESLVADQDGELQFDVEPDSFNVDHPLLREYLAYRATKGTMMTTLSPNSIPSYESRLNEYCNFVTHFGFPPDEAPRKYPKSFLNYCTSLKRRKETVKSARTKVKLFYKFLNVHHPDVNPVIGIADCMVDIEEAKEGITRTDLSYEEAELLFGAMIFNRDRLMVIVGAESGLRNDEICDLTIHEVDFVNLEICTTVKGGKKHTVPISEDLALELTIYIDNERHSHLDDADNEYLFPAEDGRISSTQFRRNVVDAAERSGIQSIIGKTTYESDFLKEPKVDKTWYSVIPHALRHTFITRLETEGVSLEYRQLLAGHENPETTLGYSHGKEEILTDCQERLRFDY